MRASKYVGLGIGLCAVMLGFALPLTASAAEVTVQTTQAIPPGGSSCTPLQVLNVHPYIENNTLQSFDVTVNNPAYVAVVTTVGNTGYSFRYITRWMNSDGTVRQHVDVQTTPIGQSLPISLTLLSAQTGQPVCISVISFSVTGTGSGAPSGSGNAVTREPSKPVHHKPAVPVTVPVSASTSTATTSSSVSIVRGIGLGTTLNRMCADNGSLQLWFLLITLYLIGAAVIALREPALDRSLGITSLLILIPAIILLAFWYWATTCRGANWVPVVLFVIAIASLLVALWERQPQEKMVELAPIPKKQLLPEPPRTV